MTGHARARRRDRRVYLAGHPVLFILLAATRRRPVLRLGPVVLVHGADAVREALTTVPLDRLAAGTTGAAVADAGGGGLFDQTGTEHRSTRRDLGTRLSAARLPALRARWAPLLDDAAATLAGGGDVDVVALAAAVSGGAAATLLDADVDPVRLASAARRVAAATADQHLPGRWRRPVPTDVADLLGSASGLAGITAVATVNTAVAALPRAVAWVADAGLWDDAANPARRELLAAELLRVTAASPLLPRVAAAAGTVAGHPVRPGDRLLLVARHAVLAHRRDPSVTDPAPAADRQLVFGAGAHACPGAGVARAQLTDLLAALAPHRPRVVRARADRRSALPSWATLVVRAGR